MDIDVAFSRELLKQIAPQVKAVDSSINVWGKPAWVYQHMKDHWEFHFNDFYWHGSAANAFDARYKGWSAWLEVKAGGKNWESAKDVATFIAWSASNQAEEKGLRGVEIELRARSRDERMASFTIKEGGRIFLVQVTEVEVRKING